MKHPTFDADGYPTEETLQAIRDWKGEGGFAALFAFIREAWYYPDYWTTEGMEHHASTGGWSGNEDLIGALQANCVAWSLCWWSSQRGGRYVFRIPELEVKP